ncbi:MAG: SGNH/GDSL hydrolase family protein [Clostridia bacterium]|nr:SGNH/GDSL hydrolase family protein [Clostridia bacterium]
MKKVFVFFCKLAISGVLALAILSTLTLIYYNPPVSVAQPDKFTNSKFRSNVFWSDMLEGFGYGTTNDLGYNSAEDFNGEEPMLAIIGSSQTEALQVPQGKTYASQLQKLFAEDSDPGNDIACMNFGISAHFFNVSASNFEYFANSFSNVQNVVIEAGNLEFTPEELEKTLAGEYHSDKTSRGFLGTLSQKIPYARLMYKQLLDSQKGGGEATAAPAEPVEKDYEAYEAGMDAILKKLSGIAEEKGFTLSILYHNGIAVENKTATCPDDPKTVEIFKKCCEKYNIGFLDVTDRFIDHFNHTYQLPYGFSNTTMGSGHLNKVGHELIADELYKHFTEKTEEK